MATVIIIGLIVAVLSLWWIAAQQGRQLRELDRFDKSKKKTVRVSRSKK